MLKNILNSQKLIIILLVIFFILSSAWLFYISNKFSDVNYNTSWWAVYFSDPKNKSLDFVIENHSSSSNFHWEILNGKDKIKEADINLTKGNKQNISIDSQKMTDKKIIIRVSNENEIREIYKNL